MTALASALGSVGGARAAGVRAWESGQHCRRELRAVQEAGCTSSIFHCLESETCLQVVNRLYIPALTGRLDRHSITNAKSEFLQPFCIIEKARGTSTAVVGGKNISFSRDN